jgi:hypothetical protein
MMDYKAKFNKAMSVAEFYEILSENKKLHDLHYKRADVEEALTRLGTRLPHLKIIVLTETWCGDSLAIVPVLLMLLEGIDNVEVRFLLRDENPDLMDLYLTNGSRSIPKIIFLDKDYHPLGHWGPRPKVVQEIFETHRADINAGKIEKTEVIKKIRIFYSKDRGRVIAGELSGMMLDVTESVDKLSPTSAS